MNTKQNKQNKTKQKHAQTKQSALTWHAQLLRLWVQLVKGKHPRVEVHHACLTAHCVDLDHVLHTLVTREVASCAEGHGADDGVGVEGEELQALGQNELFA